MKKGFSLVELVAVISILAVVTGLIVIDVNYYKNQRNQKDYDNLQTLIIENTKVLVNTNNDISSSVSNKLYRKKELNDETVVVACKLNYSILVDNKLMDYDTINPLTDKRLIDTNSYIKISFDKNNNYKYEFITGNNSSIDNCLE